MKKSEVKNIATNRRAFHDFFIDDKIEAGIELKGTEVKSLREGQLNLKSSYAKIINDEVILFNCHISPYTYSGGYDNHEPERERKLLLHRKEIRRLQRSIETKGCTLVPTRFYFNESGKVKVEIGIVRGKRQFDKRDAIAERDAKRELGRLRKGNF